MQTASASVSEEFLTDDLGFEEISMLPIDHPGAHDPEYRARRNFIARMAKQYREDPLHVIPNVDYTPQETDIWRHVYDQLRINCHVSSSLGYVNLAPLPSQALKVLPR